jgi:hypothetical protein
MKTGLSRRLREWMRQQVGPFSAPQAANALGIVSRVERSHVTQAFGDFRERGEIVWVGRALYRYNANWRPSYKGDLRTVILRAMYVCTEWTVSEIVALAETREKSYVHRITKELIRKGYLYQAGRARCMSGPGKEKIYRVSDRFKFRKELL